MAVDATMRPLKIPPKYVPYLESHHIYDLFYDMAIALIKFRPEDTITFLKTEMTRYKKRKGSQRRIIFINPKHMEIKLLADALSDATGSVVLTLKEVVNEYSIKKNEEEPLYNPELLAVSTRKHIDTKKYYTRGWILVDFPRTKDEAKALQKQGVLPTHTLELIHTPTDYAVNDLWNNKLSEWTYDKFRSMMIEYKRRAHDLRLVYSSSYKRIIIRGRPLHRLIADCNILLRKMPRIGEPLLPRVVLIGSRGSRRRTIASLLQKRFKLVHVHFWSLLARASKLDDNLGEELRHMDESININISLQLLEERLLKDDCLTHGWVLTGFPNDETDFKALDSFDSPPNRVIFLGISNEKCMERLKDRRINVYTGEVMSMKSNARDSRMQEQLAVHPDDLPHHIEIEQEVFSGEIQSMLEYCEHKAAIVNAAGPLNEVFERVESVIMNPQAFIKRRKLEISQSLYNQFSEVM